MADGLNEARALRVVEIINDFRTLQLHISQLKSDAPRGQESEEGYVLMQQCVAEAQQLLASPFSTDIPRSNGTGEAEKIQLQRIIVDSSCRRFQAHGIYLRMAAARRWEMNRAQALQGQKSEPRRNDALALANQTLRNELSQITDSYIVNDLHAADLRAGHWLSEDPSLSTILNWIRSQS